MPRPRLEHTQRGRSMEAREIMEDSRYGDYGGLALLIPSRTDGKSSSVSQGSII